MITMFEDIFVQNEDFFLPANGELLYNYHFIKNK